MHTCACEQPAWACYMTVELNLWPSDCESDKPTNTASSHMLQNMNRKATW